MLKLPTASTARAPGARRSAGRTRVRATLALCAAALLSACGGGVEVVVDGGGGPAASCSLPDQKAWLRSYMKDWYFWYATSPDPAAGAYATVDDYFKALLYTGTDPNFPADRWSYVSSTASYSRFFTDGQTLGYGVLVAGLEVSGHPEWPLYVRYVDPNSPAALAGVQRGDQILSVNGRAASALISAGDYSALSASTPGESVTLVLANANGQRSLTLSSAVYNLVPVNTASVVTSPGGRRLGYLVVKDMIDQALSPADAAFAQFKAAGIQDLVIDLRYNGGGLVSAAAGLASFPAGPRTSGQLYGSLLFNDRHASANRSYRFADYANALNLSKVYVLTGARTCSASEQLINGLRPFVNVVTIGDTTCGKPVGFTAQDDGCGSTWSAVTFESANARNEGRYFNGFAPTCPVAEDFGRPLGSSRDPLLSAAAQHADGGGCPAASTPAQGRSHVLGLRAPAERGTVIEPAERQGMLAR